MAGIKIQVTLDPRLVDMMAGLDKSLTVRTALVNLFKLDPLTLIPLADIEREQETRRLKLMPSAKPKGTPKTYAACVNDDERIAFREAEGYRLGGDHAHPEMWLKIKPNPHSAAHPIVSHWHYDPEVMDAYHAHCATPQGITMSSRMKVVEAQPVEIDESYVLACAGITDEENHDRPNQLHPRDG